MARTFQQWVSSQRAEGHEAADIQAAFKQQFGDDLAALDADADYDAYKASKVKPVAAAPATTAVASKPDPIAAARLARPFTEAVGALTGAGQPVKQWNPGPLSTGRPGDRARAAERVERGARLAAAADDAILAAGAPDVDPVLVRKKAEAAATGAQALADARSPEKRDLQPRWNLWDNLALGGAIGAPVGVAKAVLGDSKFTRHLGVTPELMQGAMEGDAAARLPGIRKRIVESPEFKDLPEFADWGEQADTFVDAGGNRRPAADMIPGETDAKGEPVHVRGEGIGGPREGISQGAGGIKAVRQSRAVDTQDWGWASNAARVANAGADVMDNIKVVLELANAFGGVSMVQKGEAPGKRTMDLSQNMVEGGIGSTIDLGANLFSLAPDASWQTAPLSTFFAVVDPLYRTAKRTPAGAKVIQQVDDGFRKIVVTPLVEQVVNRVVSADKRADLGAAVKRMLVDGISQADPRLTAIAEDLLFGTDEKVARAELALEQLVRQVEQQKVTLDTPEMRPVALSVIPPGDAREAVSAEKAVGKAEAVAGVAGGLSDAAAQTAVEAKGVKGAVNWLGKSANRAGRGIAGAARQADNAINAGAASVATDLAKQEGAALDLGDIALPLAERMEQLKVPKIARPEVLASKAARDFDKAQAEYLAAAREAKVDPSGFAKNYQTMRDGEWVDSQPHDVMPGLAADVAEAGENLAAKQLDAMPTTEANAAIKAANKAGRQAQPKVFATLRAFERATEALGRHLSQTVDQVQAAGGRAAAAGLGLVDDARAIDADTAAGMSSEVATMARQQARKAEKAADAVADDLAGAGERPPIAVGDVYVQQPNATARAVDLVREVSGMDEAAALAWFREIVDARTNPDSVLSYGEVLDKIAILPEKTALLDSLFDALASFDRDPARRRPQPPFFGAPGDRSWAIEPPVVVPDPVRPGQTFVGESVTAMQPGSSTFAQQQSLRELFPNANPAELRDIDNTIAAASSLRKQAIEAGFPDSNALPGSVARVPFVPKIGPANARTMVGAPVAGSPMLQALARWPDLKPDATMYDVARKAAEDIKDRAVGKGRPGALEGVLAEFLRQLGVPDAAVDVSAKWLLTEVEARDHGKRLEVPQGTIRRPPPEVTRYETQADGSIKEMPEAGNLQERMAPTAPVRPASSLSPPLAPTTAGLPAPIKGDLPELDPPRRALQEAQERVDRQVVQEAPKAYRAIEAGANKALDDFAKVMRDAGYHHDMTVPGTEVALEPMRLADLPPDKFTAVVDDHIKQLSPERIAQRLLDPLEGDSTQLMQIPVVRNAALERLDANAKKAGLTPAQRDKLLVSTAEQWGHPSRSSAISKQRFVEIRHELAPNEFVDLWTREDYALVRAGLDPKVLAKATAQRIKQIGNQMIAAMATYSDIQAVFSELNRFRRTPANETILDTLGNVKGYADEVVRRVLVEGEVRPALAPYEGARIAKAMRGGAARYADELGVDVAAVEKLAARMDKLQAADGKGKVKGSNLQEQWGQTWREQFGSTQDPPSFANVYVDPGVMPALRAELQARNDINSLLGPAGLVGALANRALAGLVAESLPALINNTISNIVLDQFHEASPVASLSDPMDMVIQLKAFQDGKTGALSPEQLRRIRDLSLVGIVETTQLAKDVGQTNLWQQVVATMPEQVGKPVAAYNARTKGTSPAAWFANKFNTFSDLQQEAYQKLGDSPFRLAKAARTYDHLGTFFDAMEPGTAIEVPIGTARKALVEANGDGRFTIKDASGPRAELKGRQVAADSPELGRIKALAGKVEQEALYFDYGRIGTWGKHLRGSGKQTVLAGIFSWYMKAVDIPGVKKGLGAKALSGPHQYTTDSRAVQVLQGEARQVLAAKRAVMEAAIQGVLQDEQKRKELTKAFGYDKTIAAAFVSASTSEDHVNVRDVGMTNFAGPSLAVLGMVEGGLNWLAFDGIRDDPKKLRAFLAPSPEARMMAATGETDPGAAKAKLDAMPPEAAKAAYVSAKAKQDMAVGQFFRFASGQDTNPTKILEMAGLGGAALFGPLARMLAAGRGGSVVQYGFGDAAKDWSKQLFGSNIFRMVDAGAATLEEAGVPGAGTFTNRGRQEARQGFNAATMDPNVASLGRYVVRTLAGVGAQEILFKEVQTGTGKLQGRLQTYLEQYSAALTAGLLAEAKRQADLGNPEAKETVRIIRDFVIKPEVLRLRRAIEPQFTDMKRKATPSPIVNPAPPP